MMRNRRVLTIDGPAGSGKSTTARAIAEALGWRFLDTGATYRAMTVALLGLVRQRLRQDLGEEPNEQQVHETAIDALRPVARVATVAEAMGEI